jgi:16S rRNA (uracil1498-N3)-methyltransferase
MHEPGRTPRLHLEGELVAGAVARLEAATAHRLRHVLRLGAGDSVRLFNAAAGEWRATLVQLDRRGGEARVEELLRPAAAEPGARLAVPPIRAGRIDWLVEKAVELGVATLDLVLTRRTVVRPERIDRLRAIAVEAAEQCGRLSLPALAQPRPLERWLADLPPGLPILVADEAGGEPAGRALARCPEAVLLIGPEGGLAPEERAGLAARPGTVAVGLGPRILRTETAALWLLAARAALQGTAADAPPTPTAGR